MGTSLHKTKDCLPISKKTKKSLKRQMARWRRRKNKTDPEEVLRTPRHVGWFW
jgi:hypothetical protein